MRTKKIGENKPHDVDIGSTGTTMDSITIPYNSIFTHDTLLTD